MRGCCAGFPAGPRPETRRRPEPRDGGDARVRAVGGCRLEAGCQAQYGRYGRAASRGRFLGDATAGHPRVRRDADQAVQVNLDDYRTFGPAVRQGRRRRSAAERARRLFLLDAETRRQVGGVRQPLRELERHQERQRHQDARLADVQQRGSLRRASLRPVSGFPAR